MPKVKGKLFYALYGKRREEGTVDDREGHGMHKLCVCIIVVKTKKSSKIERMIRSLSGFDLVVDRIV